MRKILSVIICFIMICLCVSCAAKNEVQGKYVSESGKYTLEMKDENVCVWYQEIAGKETFFEGTYEKDGEIYNLLIRGDGFFVSNTSFTAEPTDDGLIITGGVVDGELFLKQ